MDRDFWLARWQENRIGFHEGKPNALLAKHASLLPGAGRALVPLCGKARDLDFLAERGLQVMGIELAERAVADYFAERGQTPEVEQRGSFELHRHGAVTIALGDALAADEASLGTFDFLYDRAALIALPLPMRLAYARVMASLVCAGARGLLITLEHDEGSGPPFSVPRSEVDEAYSAAFEIRELESADVTEESGHIRDKGASRVFERAYELTRK